MARRLGSPLDAILELRDSHGRRISCDEVRVGDDPVLAYRLPEDGEYLMMIANLGFGGGPEYVYRITASSAPFIYSAFPPGGRSGETREIEFLALSGAGSPRIVKESVSFPAGHKGPFWYRSRNAVNAVLLSAGDIPEVTAPDRNHSADPIMDVSPPIIVNGRFRTETDEGYYRFAAKRRDYHARLSAIPSRIARDAAFRD